ncbi:RNA polymerase sigma factor [Kineococcus gynurae]|uniref:RNA polymerase sigma factor n=1 Tax=Kineococcus gynurae TaxID=452979 RepID=A0ABV5LTW6_9ACTN
MSSSPVGPGGDDRGAAAALADVAATSHGRIMGAVIALVQDWQVAEDSVQDAYERALSVWSRDGVPDNPAGWIVTVARRRSIDRFRRESRHQAAVRRYVAEVGRGVLAEAAGGPGPGPDAQPGPDADDESPIGDDRLRLIFTCTHPALPLASRVALTLRTVLGLDVARIASLLVQTEAATQKRLVRARAKIGHAAIPYRVPAREELPERLHGVLAVVYLLFATGYNSPDDPGSTQLRGEAIRLARLLVDLLGAAEVDPSEAEGLLGLLLAQESRHRARTDAAGARILLADQDRRSWDRRQILEASRLVEGVLRRAAHRRQPVGTYTLQAAIALEHSRPEDPRDTDWGRISRWHRVLSRIDPSPNQQMAAAVALGHAERPEAGLQALQDLADQKGVTSTGSWHACRGHLLECDGRPAEAAAAYRRAGELTDSPPDREQLLRRAASCAPEG